MGVDHHHHSPRSVHPSLITGSFSIFFTSLAGWVCFAVAPIRSIAVLFLRPEQRRSHWTPVCINKLPPPTTSSTHHPQLSSTHFSPFFSPSSTLRLQPDPFLLLQLQTRPSSDVRFPDPFPSSSEAHPAERSREDEEQEAGRRRSFRRGREHEQRRRGRLHRQQDGEEGRGEEPEAAHEGPLPQALRPRPAHLHAPHPPLPHLGQRLLALQQQQQQGRDHAARPAGQRGGVHQAAQGPDRRPEAPQRTRRWRRRRSRLLLLLLRRRQHQGSAGASVAARDRGASPGRDAGRGAGQRGREALQAARGDRGAGAGGRRGRQRQLFRRRRQDLLHAPLPGALPQDRTRGRQGLAEDPRTRRHRGCHRRRRRSLLHGLS